MTEGAFFRPGELWLDDRGVAINAHGGGILRHEGTYYWFGEHKVEGRRGNQAHVGVHAYTSADLLEWHDAGIAFAVEDDPTSEIARGCILERPKVIFNQVTGKFVLWFHLEPAHAGYTAARSGVAVADAPCGPYHSLGSLRPNAGVWPLNASETLCHPPTASESEALACRRFTGGAESDFPADLIHRRDHVGGQMARDMTLFVDDDGTAYHLYASEENGTLHLSQLTADYLRPAGRYVRLFPGGFHEAPALMKRAGKYYLFTSGCTGWRPNALRLAVAHSIWGPWTELGNPVVGELAERATTFHSQPTFILPVAGRDKFIFMADRWQPENAIDGRYVWLPLDFATDHPTLAWRTSWRLADSAEESHWSWFVTTPA